MPTKTKKLTKKQTEFIKLVQGIIGRLNDYDKIETILLKNGFKDTNGGGYKTVFRKRGYDYCVKVWHHSWGWEEDSYRVPKILENHFVHPIYKNRRYLIQPWIKGNYSDNVYKKPVRRLPTEVMDSLYDIRDDNIRVRGNREVVIDFCYGRAKC